MEKNTADSASPATPSRFLLYAIMMLSVIFGGGSLLVFGYFLFAGPLHLLDMRLDGAASLWLDACLCLIFFIQHSAMVRRSFQKKLVCFVRSEYHAALYAITSGVVLLAMMVLWQETEHLFSPYPLFPWLMRGIFLLSVIGFIVAVLSLKGFDPLGIRELRRHTRDVSPRKAPFSVHGPFRRVRHPFYFLSLVMIWACPNLTADRLLFNFLFTIWIIIGTYLEERDLVAFFGDDYVTYQQQVPMLIPYRLKNRAHETSGNEESK